MKFSESDLSIPLGAGAIISTPKEVIQFGEALFNEIGDIFEERLGDYFEFDEE